MSYTPHNALDKACRDKRGEVVIWQSPNVPLWGWIVFTILAKIMAHGRPHHGLHLLAQASLFTWAYLEIRSGASLFRRALGTVVLAAIGMSFFR